jgi:ATPase subunit of ABC transporter with duplicated ATPase domains
MRRGARARSTKQKAHIQRYENLRDQKGPEIQEKIEMSSASSRLGRTTIEIENGNFTMIEDNYHEHTGVLDTKLPPNV